MIINAINEILPQQSIDNINFNLDDTRDNLPFLVNLTNKQRKRAFKMSHKRYHFVATAIDAIKAEPLSAPSWVNPTSLQNDYILYNQLFAIENKIEALLLDIKDTRTQIASEALKTATDIYAHVQNAKDRIPGMEAIFDALKTSYPGRGKAIKEMNNE